MKYIHRYRRGQGSNPGKPDFFFQAFSFRNCISCVNNCEDLLYIYLFIPQFKYISYIHNFIFIFPGYITNQFNDQLPVGLLAQLVRALHRYRRGQGSNPGKPDFFFQAFSFRNCISCVNNCEDLLYIYLFIPQFKYISYIHNFIFIFPGYNKNQFNDQLPVGLLAQLVRALHRYRRGQGSNPGKPDFFQAFSFRNCILSCVNNCEDLLYIYLFIPQFKYISYIHNFIFIFPGYNKNQFNDQLPVGLLAQLVRALHRYRRGQGSNPGKPDFFFSGFLFSQLHKLR